MTEVWVSVAMMAVASRWGFLSDFYTTHKDVAFNAMRDSKKGLPVAAEHSPGSVYADARNAQPGKLSKLPPLFFSGALFLDNNIQPLVSEEVRGGCTFHPVETFMHDRSTPLPNSYSIMNVGNIKSCLIPEKCIGLRANPYMNPPVWQAHEHIKDMDVAVDSSALDGPQIWIDPRLFDAFFVSGQIADNFISAGLVNAMQLRKCALV